MYRSEFVKRPIKTNSLPFLLDILSSPAYRPETHEQCENEERSEGYKEGYEKEKGMQEGLDKGKREDEADARRAEKG